MDYEGFVAQGSMLGSAGTIVVDDSTCMVWVARKLFGSGGHRLILVGYGLFSVRAARRARRTTAIHGFCQPDQISLSAPPC